LPLLKFQPSYNEAGQDQFGPRKNVALSIGITYRLDGTPQICNRLQKFLLLVNKLCYVSL